MYDFMCCGTVQSLQSCPTLCDPNDHRMQGSSVPGILQGTEERPPPGDLPDPEIELVFLESLALAGRFFTTSATWEAHNFICIYNRLLL